MTDIFLLRHGKSDWKVEVDDFYRPLNKRGCHASYQIGLWLKAQALLPERIWCSPAIRAKETAEKLIEAANLSADIVEYQAELYEATGSELMRFIDKAKNQNARILIVGHNPSMESALTQLVAEQLTLSIKGKVMPTATLAHLCYSNGYWYLVDLVHARSLAKKD